MSAPPMLDVIEAAADKLSTMELQDVFALALLVVSEIGNRGYTTCLIKPSRTPEEFERALYAAISNWESVRAQGGAPPKPKPN